jgi:DNA/RNA-binding protein KIN17
MGKSAGFLTPKAIGNRIKAKGLQRLRWYCQMCEKQCRDENGFQCHLTSESHLRQMRVFAENPGQIMENYSKDFEEGFMDILSRRFGTKRVKASQVYNEYIAFKQHVHMNSTKWTTLTNFVMYLGKEGKAIVEETEKGLFIQWINRDPALLARHEAADKKRKADEDSEELQMKIIKSQQRALSALGGEVLSAGASELDLEGRKEAIKMAVPSSSSASTGGAARKRPRGAAAAFMEQEDAKPSASAAAPAKGGADSALEKLMREDEARKATAIAVEESRDRKEYWLHTGIVVKVMNKKVGDGKYYKRKARVRKVIDRYVGEVKMLDDDGDVLRVDQEQLETVVPSAGGRVLMVNGRGRGSEGELLRIDVDNFCASIKVATGKMQGTTLEKVDYEDFSKLA